MKLLLFSILSVFSDMCSFVFCLFIHRIYRYKYKKPINCNNTIQQTFRIFKDNHKAPLLSIIIPALNEQFRIEETCSKLFEYLMRNDIIAEIIFVDDGSIDETVRKCYSFSSRFISKMNTHISVIISISHRNYGKGKAILSGLSLASSSTILIMDADGATNLDEISNFLRVFKKKELLCGCRIAKGRKSIIRNLTSRLFRHLKSIILGLQNVKDTQCGFKMFSKNLVNDVLPHIKLEGWSFDLEFILHSINQGYEVKCLNVDWVDKEGSKLRLLEDVPTMLLDLCILGIVKRVKMFA